MFQFYQQPHDIVDELVVLVALCSPGDLHINFKISLNYDGTVQKTGFSVPVGEGEVPQVFTHCEIPLIYPLNQANAFQLANDLLLLFSYLVTSAGVHE